MGNTLWRKLSSSITGGALIIAVASVVSRFMGLVRDNLLAKYFGASATLDIYNAAFKVPDLIFNILVLGALSASFIPVFIEIKQKHDLKKAFQTANAVLNILVIAVIVAVGIGILIAPWIAHWLMAERPLEQEIATTQLMRIMLVSVIFFALSNIFSGVLNSLRRFMAYALAPIMYNFGIIFGIIFLYPHWGMDGLAYGVVCGAALHCIIQLPALYRTGFRYRWTIKQTLPGVRKIFRLMPSRALALGIVQLNSMFLAALVLRLPEGSLAIWTWADNLQNFPINVFGVSLALSSFPVFSQAFAEKNLKTFKEIFSNNFRRILFLIIPISVMILLLRAQIVRLILGSFGGGAFDWSATILTAQVLGLFSISMFAQATIPLLARSFFAHQDTKTPVFVSIISTVLTVSLAWILSSSLGIYGLAIAFTVSALFTMLALLLILRIKFGNLDDERIVRSTWNIIITAFFMGIIIHGLKYFVEPFVDTHTFIGILIQTIVSIGGGALFYIVITLWFEFDEVVIIRQYIQKLMHLLKRLSL